MGYKVGVDKKQLSLLPSSLDDFVSEDHICRFIYSFTEQLDLVALGYKYAEYKATGCRPYDPRMMLNLYIYGYLHRVRSSRRLRDETQRNVEVMWLMEGLRPDDKTICNFRKDNTKALKETFRVFSRMCRELGLYGGKVVATDSVKIKANNSLGNNYNKTVVKNALERIDKRITEYLNALEEGDREEDGEAQPSSDEIKAALEKLKLRQVKYEELKDRLETEGEICTVDPDSRLMRSGGDGRKIDVRYNIQTVVDSKNHLIVDFDVSSCSNDCNNLKKMSDMAMEILDVKTITNMADAGYYDSEDIIDCEQNGITCLVAKRPLGGPKKAEGFNRGDFIYDSKKDVYICPDKNELLYMRKEKRVNKIEHRVYANYSACGKCKKKSACTTHHHREILRIPNQDILDAVDERTLKNKALYRKRQEIVEHCFGTIKAVWGYGQFLCRTKPKVTAETALAYMAYNLRRVFNITTDNKMKLALAMG